MNNQLKSITKDLKHELEKITLFLENKKPAFLFDDDADGLSSFLLFYHYINGRGLPVIKESSVSKTYINKIKYWNFDTLIILDKPGLDDDFINNIFSLNKNILWIDHHKPFFSLEKKRFFEKKNLFYFNPRLFVDNNNLPTTFWVWQLINKATKNNFYWIALSGLIGDWVIPRLEEDFNDKIKELIPIEWLLNNDFKNIYLNSKAGLLSRIMNFNLKGSFKDILTSVKVFAKIKDPFEIINQTTSKGRFLYKKYFILKKEYDSIKKSISFNKEERVLFITYNSKQSFTSELSNELLLEYPNKIIVVAREDNDELKISIRSGLIPIDNILKNSVKGIGSGGGHKFACGAVIKKRYWDEFKKRFLSFLS